MGVQHPSIEHPSIGFYVPLYNFIFSYFRYNEL